MKNLFKKVPAILVVSLIIVVTVALTILAASFSYDITGDGNVDNNDVVAVMKSITGKELLPNENLADYDENGVINVLDVISLKKYMFFLQNISDDWTKGIY